MKISKIDKILRARRMYEQGMIQADIAKALGVSVPTIKRFVSKTDRLGAR